MNSKHAHWENVYQTKSSDGVSWYCEHLTKSLQLIKQSASSNTASIIDVGGGHATLVDDLLDEGFDNVSVLDISATAIAASKKRLGDRASQVTWLVGDITNIALSAQQYDIWHDRAVFHFLTEREQREAYVKQVARSVKLGGYVIVATFGENGPVKCSGLDVVRYNANMLHREFGNRFELIGSTTELHQTPFNTTQQFLYCYFKVVK